MNRGVYLIPQLAGVFGGDGVQLSWGQQGTILYYNVDKHIHELLVAHFHPFLDLFGLQFIPVH